VMLFYVWYTKGWNRKRRNEDELAGEPIGI
jgi:hypothetical protein